MAIPVYDPNARRQPDEASLLRRIGRNLGNDATELRRAFASPAAAEDAIGAALAPSIAGTGLRNASAIGLGLRGAAAAPLSAQVGLAGGAAAPVGTSVAGAAVPAALLARNDALAAPAAAGPGMSAVVNPSVGDLSARGALRRPVSAVLNPTADQVPTLRRSGPPADVADAEANFVPQVAAQAPVQAAQMRGSQGAIIANPNAASAADRIAMMASSVKGSPSLRRATAEAILAESGAGEAMRQQSLNRDAAAAQFNAQQSNAVATGNADRGLRAGLSNAELQLRDTERRDTQEFRGAGLALQARQQLMAERTALASAVGAGSAVNKRYDQIAADYMERNPQASYAEAADFAGNQARLQGVGADASLVGRGATAMEGERISELAGQAVRGRNPDRSAFNPLSLYDGSQRAVIDNRVAGLSNGRSRSITTDAGNFNPRRQNLREFATSLVPGGMSPGDVVWEDTAAGNAFSATPESLRGMTLEQWRNRYGRRNND